MAKEYVSREDVINDIGELFTICRETYPNECGHHFIVEDELQIHLDHVRNLPPADVVAVVRCGECIRKNICWVVSGDDNWYCADGKREDGGQDDV